VDPVKGILTAEIVDVRFSFAGKVSAVRYHPGDRVDKGKILATLDRRELQIILDKELADYEKVRAEFEIFVLDNISSTDDRAKFKKVQAQALLNASVKAVELAKLNLDAADLVCPVTGIVQDNGGIRPGMHITPGSYSYRILDLDSLIVQLSISGEMENRFQPDVKVSIRQGESEVPGTVLPSIPVLKGDSFVRIRPDIRDNLHIGSPVEVLLTV